MATISVSAAGWWTFGVNSDDGFRLGISKTSDLSSVPFTSYYGTGTTLDQGRLQYSGVRTSADSLGVVWLAAGDYNMDLLYYQGTSFAEAELFAAPGSHSAWNTSFRLVGDKTNGGLEVNSVPFTGPEIARKNAPTSVAWNSQALAERPSEVQSSTFETVDITSALNLGNAYHLQATGNVLAIQALRASSSDADMLVLPEIAQIASTSLGNHVFAVPTPAAANSREYWQKADDPAFSKNRGFYDGPFQLALSTSTAGASIYYTLDGSAPWNANIATLLTSAITFSGATAPYTATVTLANHGYVNGNLLKVAGADQAAYNGVFPIFAAAYEPSDVDTQTYIFLEDVLNQPANPAGFPLNWNGLTADYAMDPRIVDDPAYMNVIKDSLRAIPTMSIVSDRSDLFDSNRGVLISALSLAGGAYAAPQAAISLEYIDPDGGDDFQVNAGLQMAGGASRGAALRKHGMRVVFRDEFGASKLNFPLFGNDATDSFDSFILRCSYGDQWTVGGSTVQFIKDDFASATQRALGDPSRHGSMVHVYIDGLYWGIFDMAERPDASFAASYMGGDKDDWEANNAGYDNDTTATLPYWNSLLSNTKVGFQTTGYQAGVPGFNTTLYASGASSTPGFTSIYYKANVTVASVTDAESVILTPSKQTTTATHTVGVVNYLNTGASGHFTGTSTPTAPNNNFPGISTTPVDNFVVETTSSVTILTAGYWTFGASTNDGFQATLSNGTDTYTFSRTSTTSTPADTFGAFNIKTPGAYRLRLVYFQNTGGAELELFAASGNYSAWTSAPTAWHLVGDTFKTVNFTKAGSYTLRLVYYQSTTAGAELELYAAKGEYAAWAATTTWQLVGANTVYTSTTMTNAGVLSLPRCPICRA